MSGTGDNDPASPGNVLRLPIVRDSAASVSEDADAVDAPAAELLDQRAQQRERAALTGDQAVEPRGLRTLDREQNDRLGEDQMHAARVWAAAALDREEATLDRYGAPDYLKRTYRDELTGALQRDAGRDQLFHEVERAHRAHDGLAVAFIDVVRLKRINDEHGHAAGDALLGALGDALRSGLRSYDVVVRYGGDEFVCALPKATLAVAARRFRDVAKLLRMTSPGARISIGLAALATDEHLDSVIGRADRELFDGRRLLAAVAEVRHQICLDSEL